MSFQHHPCAPLPFTLPSLLCSFFAAAQRDRSFPTRPTPGEQRLTSIPSPCSFPHHRNLSFSSVPSAMLSVLEMFQPVKKQMFVVSLNLLYWSIYVLSQTDLFSGTSVARILYKKIKGFWRCMFAGKCGRD